MSQHTISVDEMMKINVEAKDMLGANEQLREQLPQAALDAIKIIQDQSENAPREFIFYMMARLIVLDAYVSIISEMLNDLGAPEQATNIGQGSEIN